MSRLVFSVNASDDVISGKKIEKKAEARLGLATEANFFTPI
jgi:hypothetical protein